MARRRRTERIPAAIGHRADRLAGCSKARALKRRAASSGLRTQFCSSCRGMASSVAESSCERPNLQRRRASRPLQAASSSRPLQAASRRPRASQAGVPSQAEVPPLDLLLVPAAAPEPPFLSVGRRLASPAQADGCQHREAENAFARVFGGGVQKVRLPLAIDVGRGRGAALARARGDAQDSCMLCRRELRKRRHAAPREALLAGWRARSGGTATRQRL